MSSSHEGKNLGSATFVIRIFTSRGVLKTHIEHVHEKIKQYSCNSCNHKSVTTADLKKHITAVRDKKKPYTCNIFHKSYASSSTIYNFPHQNGT